MNWLVLWWVVFVFAFIIALVFLGIIYWLIKRKQK